MEFNQIFNKLNTNKNAISDFMYENKDINAIQKNTAKGFKLERESNEILQQISSLYGFNKISDLLDLFEKYKTQDKNHESVLAKCKDKIQSLQTDFDEIDNPLQDNVYKKICDIDENISELSSVELFKDNVEKYNLLQNTINKMKIELDNKIEDVSQAELEPIVSKRVELSQLHNCMTNKEINDFSKISDLLQLRDECLDCCINGGQRNAETSMQINKLTLQYCKLANSNKRGYNDILIYRYVEKINELKSLLKKIKT